MTLQRDTLLCRYYYDPQDRIAGCSPLNQDSVQRFYRKDRLTTEIQGQGRHSVFEHEAQILAQQQSHAGKFDCALLATDLQRSVLHLVSAGRHQQTVYSPYGHRFPEGGLISLLGFNGQRRDPVTGHYLLGNGYRAFNPVLMRFNSPDNLSPFGKGGVNAYAYCAGDPVNRVDPTGHHFAVVLFTGLTPRVLVQRAYSVVDSTVRSLAGKAVDAVNNLRPSYRAAKADELVRTTNVERLASIDKYNRIKSHLTDAPPFTATRSYAAVQKAAVEDFIGPRYLENAPAQDFNQLLENSALADASLKRVIADDRALQLERVQMDAAVQAWQQATGFGMADLMRNNQLAQAIRRTN
ncbi:RHS repeat-associated core domain-containing protein [Pseudomonas sp. NFX98]|uniref:RHS repeat-associated core domain-containing protein n=1 Tax=Pseudomonas sp. NFX98 TaxID=3399122 RepID=UPI0039FDB510